MGKFDTQLILTRPVCRDCFGAGPLKADRILAAESAENKGWRWVKDYGWRCPGCVDKVASVDS